MSDDFSTCDNCCDPTGNQPLTLCDACNEGPDEDRIRDAALERAAQEAERSVVEFSALDELDVTPERVRIARRIRALKGGSK